MFEAARIPELSHIETGSPAHYVTTQGRVGTAYRLPIFDSEAQGFEADFAGISQLVSRLKPGVLLRFIHHAEVAHESRTLGSRKEAIQALGYKQQESLLIVDGGRSARLGLRAAIRSLFAPKQKADTPPISHDLQESYDSGLLGRLRAVPLDEPEIRKLFPGLPGVSVVGSHGIDSGDSVTGILRIWRQSTLSLAPETLSVLLEEAPKPYTVSVTVRKLTPVRAQYILQRRRGQLAASTDTLAARTYQQTDEIAAETVLSGKGLVEIEWLLTLKRHSEAELRDDLSVCQRLLSRMGDCYIEVQGAAASFAATLPGSDPHHTFIELDEVAPYFLPIFSCGEGPTLNAPQRALPLHRRDGSLYLFDLWREGYDGANCVINGRRGKGKSVLANLISTALLTDPSVRLIKVDVGGSYVKECELAGGRHVQFNLSEPSGLNPFALLTQCAFTQDAAMVLSGFLSTLILESRETVLSKEMLGSVEKAVLAYAETSPKMPSLDHFLAHSTDFPRRALLERFTEGGVFANVLKARPEGSSLGGFDGDRYVYFNFERLQNAANEDFAQAVMGAVIAAVNMEVLRAGDARRGAKHRVVFFADETPFFIQRNGRFFKLTTANFRKFGHATILIAQTTRDFELPKEGGETDYGILINSPIRFFYQVDDDPEAFAKRFGLSGRQVAEIQNLGRSDGYREVFLQDELGGRVLRIAVTREEYWRVTSSRADNEKLYALLSAVPGLKLEEAIRCLALR